MSLLGYTRYEGCIAKGKRLMSRFIWFSHAIAKIREGVLNYWNSITKCLEIRRAIVRMRPNRKHFLKSCFEFYVNLMMKNIKDSSSRKVNSKITNKLTRLLSKIDQEKF